MPEKEVRYKRLHFKEIFIYDENIKVNRQTPYFRSREINSVYHGSESLSFLGPKLWELIPVELQDIVRVRTALQFKNRPIGSKKTVQK